MTTVQQREPDGLFKVDPFAVKEKFVEVRLRARRCLCARRVISLGLSAATIICSGIVVHSQTTSTETQIWPEVDTHVQLPSQFRVLAFSGVEQGVGYPYQQVFAAAALGYQYKPIMKQHLENIDPDKEHYFVVGAGYEFLRTIQSGKLKDEDRFTIDGTVGFRPTAGFLLRDRNWTELRWINGKYSTTYRNMLTVEHDFLLHGFRFSPYGAAEVFYDGPSHSWNQEWYTAGVQWPYKRLL